MKRHLFNLQVALTSFRNSSPGANFVIPVGMMKAETPAVPDEGEGPTIAAILEIIHSATANYMLHERPSLSYSDGVTGDDQCNLENMLLLQ